MLTFSQLGKYGRLGNQLFQIASTIGIALDNGLKFGFNNWSYAKYFPHLPIRDVSGFEEIGEGTFTHHELVVNPNYNIALKGYFQSEKYFAKYADKIRLLLLFDHKIEDNLYRKWYHILSKNPIALHVRRGDYVQLKTYAELKPLYYSIALEQLDQHIPVMVFSDDIDYCKQNLRFNRQVCYVEGQSDIEDLITMSLCQHFVIANSTFSWWGAWLGEKNGSVVIAPPVWFTKSAPEKLDSRDILPDRWIKFQPGKTGMPLKKIDLSDITFTIPVQYDHEDRRENLHLIIDFLQYHFETNIMVYETGISKKLSEVSKKGVVYKFVPSEHFHRTKLLNEMCKACNTPFIANWDADVLVSYEHIYKAIEELRASKEMVYPYDGTFHRVARHHIDSVRNAMSTHVLKNLDYPQSEFDVVSYGGAVMWNKEKFMEIGMENENFISYGPEDYERHERAKKLEVKISRVTAPLYHINHFLGDDSSDKHKHFNNNVKEREKINSFSKKQLTEEVKKWSWIPKKQEKVIPLKKPGCLLNNLPIDKTYVINLDSRPERWEWVQQQLKQIEYGDYERFPAVDGKKAGLKSKDKRLTPGMLGCFQSHLNIYKDALDNHYECIMVFEDDIRPVDGFDILLKLAYKTLPQDWDFVFWGYGERGPHGSWKRQVNDYWVVPGCPWGTQAYMVRDRKNIEYLYNRLQPINMQIDEKMANVIFQETKLKYYGPLPSIFPQNMHDFESDVQTHRDNKITVTRSI